MYAAVNFAGPGPKLRAQANLVAAPSRPAEAIAAFADRMAALGFRIHSLAAEEAAAPEQADTLIIDGGEIDGGLGDDEIEALIGAWRLNAAPHAPVLLLAPPHHADDMIARYGETADVTLAGLDAPQGIAARLRLVLRRRNLEAETDLRTSAGLCAPPPLSRLNPQKRDRRILVAPAPSREFAPVARVVDAAGFSATGASRISLAFDYLRAKNHVGAVALQDDPQDASALRFCAQLRRNVRHRELPAFLIANAETGEARDFAYEMGATDIIPPTEIDTLLQPFLAAGERSRARFAEARTRLACSDDLFLDGATGVFAAKSVERHLAGQALQCDAAGRPLSLIAFRSASKTRNGGASKLRDSEFSAISTLLGRLTRAEDFPARLSEDVFMLSAPFTMHDDAEAIARRVVAVTANTPLRNGGDAPVKIMLQSGVAQRIPGESVEETLARTLAALSRAQI